MASYSARIRPASSSREAFHSLCTMAMTRIAAIRNAVASIGAVCTSMSVPGRAGFHSKKVTTSPDLLVTGRLA